MSLFNIFSISGSAMSAQSLRLNTIASNLANSDSVAGSENEAFRAKHAVFSTVLDHANRTSMAPGVEVTKIAESNAQITRQYQPDHPVADQEGFIYLSNVSPVEEMVNMMSASRSYENNVEVLKTSKELLLNTLRLGE